MKGEDPYYMQYYFEKNQIELKMQEGDLELLKSGTVDFYSFSYYMTNCVTKRKAWNLLWAISWAAPKIRT